MVKHEPWKESSPLRDHMAWPVEAVALSFPFAALAGSRAEEAFCREEEEEEVEQGRCYFKKRCFPLPGALSLDHLVFLFCSGSCFSKPPTFCHSWEVPCS